MSNDKRFSDARLRDEFLDRFEKLNRRRSEGLEGLEGGLNRKDAEKAVKRINEGTWRPHEDGGLEAIIQRFTRPVQLVQDHTFYPPGDASADSESEVIKGYLSSFKVNLDGAIPSAGRVEVSNHRNSWLGTAWMVKPNVVVTNRHVAEEFARPDGNGFAFRTNFLGRVMKASVDWRREWQRPHESVFSVTKVLWMEPDGGLDVALLQIASTNADDHAQPKVLDLASLAEIQQHQASNGWVAVIGYPAQDSRNDGADQQRIFDGIYNVKRLAPGQIRSVLSADGLLTHDATTLGGNSGSCVVDCATGKVLALHFGGLEGEANYGVQAPRLRALVDKHTPSP